MRRCAMDLATPFTANSRTPISQDLFEVDVAGHFLCAREMVQRLGPKESASIVMISSIYALCGVDPSIYPTGAVATPPQYASGQGGPPGPHTLFSCPLGPSQCTGQCALWQAECEPLSGRMISCLANYSRKTMLGRMASAPRDRRRSCIPSFGRVLLHYRSHARG